MTKAKGTLKIKKYNASIIPEDNLEIKNEIQRTQELISLYEKQIQKIGIDDPTKRNAWENACSGFLNRLTILEYAILTEEKNTHENLFAFYPKGFQEKTFLSPTTRSKVKEKIMERQVS